MDNFRDEDALLIRNFGWLKYLKFQNTVKTKAVILTDFNICDHLFCALLSSQTGTCDIALDLNQCTRIQQIAINMPQTILSEYFLSWISKLTHIVLRLHRASVEELKSVINQSHIYIP